MYTLIKTCLTLIVLSCLVPTLNAQFDDVYYDPDNIDLGTSQNDNSTSSNYAGEEDVTYYDDDEYEYYDDYDYYYSSRIRRFHNSYSGFDFYDPYYVSYNHYDPFYVDSYYYPGSSIYVSFGNSDYWSYRNWRRYNRWNRWNNYNQLNNWCLTPTSSYYSYNNNWYSPSSNYWGGYHGYHTYSNYYNNYYNSCPSPVSNYYGITNTTVTTINNGGTRGSYYGPRITGNTGSSPRGPVVMPENVQPVFKGTDNGLTQSNDKPKESGNGIRPGSVNPTTPVETQPGTVKSPVSAPVSPEGLSKDVVRDIPVDKELKREETSPISGRPVFRPYPTGDKPSSGSDRPVTDNPNNRPTPGATPNSPSRGTYAPRPTNDRNGDAPRRDDSRPQYQPTPRSNDDRPTYTPSPRSDDKPTYTPRPDDRPSYSPPPRKEERSDDRPSYTPSPRNEDSGRSNDKPSYSPSPRNDSSSGSRSNAAPSRDNSSSGSSRSSSPSGGSPRSSGRG